MLGHPFQCPRLAATRVKGGAQSYKGAVQCILLIDLGVLGTLQDREKLKDRVGDQASRVSTLTLRQSGW